MRDLTVQDLLRLLRERALIIFFVPTAAVLITAFAFSFLTREYEAAASLFVMIRYEDVAGSQRYDITAGSGLASDYSALFERANLLEAVEHEMNISGLSDRVTLSVEVAPGTRVVDIIATGGDAALCAEVANGACRLFRDYIQEFLRADIRVAREAEVPDTPLEKPWLRTCAVAGLAAFFISAFAVLARGAFNTRIQTDAQIADGLGLTVLGHLPEYRAAFARVRTPGARNAAALLAALPEEAVEAVRALSVNLRLTWDRPPAQSLLVAGTLPGEGKSALAVLLACVLAGEGTRVLLMDMDMRAPDTRRPPRRRCDHDLADYLAGSAGIDEILIPSGVDRLFFMDGCRSAALLPQALRSERFEALYTAARARFDYIVLDTPALALFVDASVLATVADGALFVVADGRAELSAAQAALTQLRRGGVPVLGAAVNRKGGRKR